MNILLIIKEEVKRLFEQPIYSIPDLVKTIKYQGYDDNYINSLISLFIEDFKKSGDEAVIKSYTDLTGVQIEAISRGRYIFANLYDPEKSNHKQKVVYENEKR